MIGLIDYGAGNLRSVANALDKLELEYRLCGSPEQLRGTDRLLLPGVGHWRQAVTELKDQRLFEPIRSRALQGKPLLGICLGMQLLFESSDEAPGVSGLGLLAGQVVALDAPIVPHMGWNQIRWKGPAPAARDLQAPQFVYFAHGYVAQPAFIEDCQAVAQVGDRRFCAVAACNHIVGTQFHPEKSGPDGLALLRDLLTLTPATPGFVARTYAPGSRLSASSGASC